MGTANVSGAAGASDRAPAFVNLASVAPTIAIEMRYAAAHNFVGEPIRGYETATCLLTPAAARALAQVQKDLAPFDLSLKVYDCYRPQRAVDHFIAWAKDIGDTRMKGEFYPRVDKKDLFKKGYIAARSSHSRGSTVDLAIVDRGDKETLDFGTPFDYFDPRSHTENPTVPAPARAHRALLVQLMRDHGFKSLKEEWWHFTLTREPYPDQYFDVPIK